MTARRYHASLNRHQELLLPMRVEDYVGFTNTVRAIDAYVDTLDLHTLKFSHTAANLTAGQPAYNPSALLKLYLYGYLQGIRSSRKLERETRRNLEVIWLTEGIQPSYKTIADFRQKNHKALKSSNKDFILLCKELALLGGKKIAVDGSFFKGDSAKDKIYTENRLNKELDRLDKKISDYQDAMDRQDREDDKHNNDFPENDDQLSEKIERLKQKQKEKQGLKKKLQDNGQKQLSMTDPDARLLRKRGQTTAGYNVQIAVDELNHLILAEAVTQEGNDMHLLYPMAEKAQHILQSADLTVLADSGYYEGNQLKACEENHISALVAVPGRYSQPKKEHKYTRDDFSYEQKVDRYSCPEGHRLNTTGKAFLKDNKWKKVYSSKARDCQQCSQREHCLSGKTTTRKLERWEHEEVIVRHKKRMKDNPASMKKRASMVEHPFGTLKTRLGNHHFLMRGLEKCQGEFSLMILSYNFTRVLNILGVKKLQEYCLQRQQNSLKISQYA